MGIKGKKNFFDASDFDEIGDALDLFINTINNSFEFDALGDKETFNAIVLSPPVPIGANGKEMDTFLAGVEGKFVDTLPKFIFRARMVEADSAHVFWPDPCDPRFIESAETQEEVIDWISKYLKVIAIGATQVPRVGDTVRVKLSRQGIFTASPEYAIMEGVITSLDSISEEARVLLNSQECQTKLETLFENYNPTGGTVVTTSIVYDSAEFVEKLRNIGHFDSSDFTDAFLAGLAANAYAESRFNFSAEGDPLSGYDPSTSSGKAANKNNINGKCSFGYFQINVCSGAGIRFAEANGFMYPLTSAKKQEFLLDYLSNEDKYLAFIASEMKRIPALDAIRTDPTIEAKQAGQFIATYFEKCRWCKKTDDYTFPVGHSTSSENNEETKIRGEIAEEVLIEYKKILSSKAPATIGGTTAPAVAP